MNYRFIPSMRVLLPISQCDLFVQPWEFLVCCPSNLPRIPRNADFAFVLFCVRKVCTEARLFSFCSTVYLLYSKRLVRIPIRSDRSGTGLPLDEIMRGLIGFETLSRGDLKAESTSGFDKVLSRISYLRIGFGYVAHRLMCACIKLRRLKKRVAQLGV